MIKHSRLLVAAITCLCLAVIASLIEGGPSMPERVLHARTLAQGLAAMPHAARPAAPAPQHVGVPHPDGAPLAKPGAARKAAAAAHRKAAAAAKRRAIAHKIHKVTAHYRARIAAVRHRTHHAATARKARHASALRKARHRATVCHRHHAGRVCKARHVAAIRKVRHHARKARHATTLRRARHIKALRRTMHYATHCIARGEAVNCHAQHLAAKRKAQHAAAVRKAKRAAARRAAQRARFELPRRTRPGHIVRGHYLRSLVGRTRDRHAMRRLGAIDAARNPRGMGHLVLLDIGGQVGRGVYLSVTNEYVSYPALVRAIKAYVNGYHARQRHHAPVTIALGTNNDLLTSARAGWLWATRVVNPVRAAAKKYSGITIAGADDIEPGFSGGPRATRAWLRGYLRNTKAPFVFNGSADGCSPTRPHSRCNHGWSAHLLALVAGAAAPSRILALPQIYNSAMAGQWAQISRTAKLRHRRALRIVGPLTEEAACGRDPSCPSMPSHRAWRLLHRELHQARLHPRSLPVQVDLDVH